MPFKIKAPETEEEFRAYYHLRWKLLRAPWGEPEGSEKDVLEESCSHLMALTSKHQCVGVARLQFNSADEAQIRYMAVAKAYQRQGIGRELVSRLENIALQHQCTSIKLDARENAVAFYLALGYTRGEKTHLLFNSVQHYLMSKELV